MPSRQGRLSTKYFSTPKQPNSRNGSSSQRAGASSNSRPASRSTQPTSQGRARENDDDAEDSEGSEGLAGIRLTESPEKPRSSGKLQADQEITNLVSDEEEDQRIEGEDPVGLNEGAEYHSEVVVAPENEGDEFEGIEDAEMPTAQPGSSNGTGNGSKFKKVVDLTKGTTTAPRKRVPISMSSSSTSPLVPIPKSFTRLRTVAEDVDAGLFTNTGPSQRELVIELKPLTDQQRATYTIWPERAEIERTARPMAIDNLDAFLNADVAPEIMALPPVREVFEVSDDDEDGEPVRASAPKSLSKPRSNFSIEIPIRRPALATGASRRAEGKSSRTERAETHRNGERGGSDKEGKGKKRATVVDEDEDESDAPRRSSKKDKGKGRARQATESSDDDSDRPLERTKTAKHDKKRHKHSPSSRSSKKRAERAPAESQQELLGELEMDEARRFETDTRLRKPKETAFQRSLRKINAKKKGIIEPDTEEEEPEPEEEEAETSDSAKDSRRSYRSHSSGSFIENDGGVVEEHIMPAQFSLNATQTPERNFKVVFHYFILLVMQGPEILPLKGSNKDYFAPTLDALRRRMRDTRDSRVRSQIWPRNYVNALETYPRYRTEALDPPEAHCLACNRTNYKSRFRLRLGGNKYDPDTFQPIDDGSKKRKAKEARRKAKKQKKKAKAKARREKIKELEKRRRKDSETPSGSEFASSSKSSSSSDSESDSDSSSDSEQEAILKRGEDIFLGSHCNKRSKLYHELHHWELNLWNNVQSLYHDLLRAKAEEIHDDSDASPSESETDVSDNEKVMRKDRRKMRREQTKHRVKGLKSKRLPKDCYNVNEVTDWMDREDYFLVEYRYLDGLQEQSRRLELDRNKDE